MQLLSPKNDVIFQKLFGNNENKELLISFLNSIITKANNEEIIDLEVEEKKLDITMIIDEKISILDIYVTTNLNTHINVEMQIINQYNMIKRTLFYWSKMFLKQLTKGENYNNLKKTITINLVDFDILNTNKVHSFYHLYEDETKEILTDIMEIHFIEMNKLKVIEGNDKLHKWLSFINDPNGKEVECMAMVDGDIHKAKDILSLISADKEVQQLAEMREKALRDEISRISGAKEEGRKEGIKEGAKQEKYNLAKKAIDNGMDDRTISVLTGLSVEEVKKLRN